MTNPIKVSIIIPVYNVPEAALRKCIESTINQTLDDIEVIIVDDGSTDDSGLICDEYARKNTRLRVIHKINGGLSAARNTGYQEAIGEWITFLDSDDWIEANTCEMMYHIGTEQDVDIVIFGAVQEFEHTKKPFAYYYQNGQVFEKEDIKKLQCDVLEFTGNIATAWAKLIKRDTLEKNHIEHNEDLRQGSEGIEFNIRLFEHIQRAYFTDAICYHYVFNPNSISAKHDVTNHYYVIKCFEEIKRQIAVSSNKKALGRRFYKRFAYVVVAAAISGYFSPVNTEIYRDKKKGFNHYLEEPLVHETLQRVKLSELDKQRAIVIQMIKFHCFFVISILAKLRYKQKHGR